MRSYIKTQLIYDLDGYPKVQDDTDEGDTVSISRPDHEFYILTLNQVYSFYKEWSQNGGKLQTSPLHVLDWTLVLPYAKHPLN